jgi:hypothetical protein
MVRDSEVQLLKVAQAKTGILYQVFQQIVYEGQESRDVVLQTCPSPTNDRYAEVLISVISIIANYTIN